MKRSVLFSSTFAAFGLACLASAGWSKVAWSAPPPLPPLPSAPSPGSRPGAAPPSQSEGGAAGALPGQASPPQPGAQPFGAGLTPMQVYEHVVRGVVAIERNGLPVAIGTVLGSDGRILTSLSGLGGADGVDVRYVDGTTVHAKVDRSDRTVDLALLVAQSGKWLDGLSASESDPLGADVRAMVPDRSAHFGPAPVGLKGLADARTRDGEPLAHMLDVDVKGPTVAGAPLLDANGNVVAVLARACRGAAPASPEAGVGAWPASPAQRAAAACLPMVIGVPVSTIRSFLTHSSASASASASAPPVPAAWLGIRGEAQSSEDVHGVRVVAVAPSSPADKGGLRPSSDVIVAVDGRAVDTPARLAEAIGKHAPGDTVKLLVFGDGKFREASVALRPAP